MKCKTCKHSDDSFCLKHGKWGYAVEDCNVVVLNPGSDLHADRKTIKGDYTSKEIEYLKENYGKMKTSALFLILKRSPQNIRSKASKMGLKFARTVENTSV